MQPTCFAELQGSLPVRSNLPVALRHGAIALFLALVGPVLVGLTTSAAALSSPAALDDLRGTADTVVVQPGFRFDLTKSGGASACLPNARGAVRLSSLGASQQMDVLVTGLPANDTFTVFVLQVPHAPFGLSWYQGDIHTDRFGVGRARFVGIFSDETFVVAPGVAPAPALHPADANVNPQTAPVHMFHLGLWFDSTAEAAAAGCPTGQTPFNGDHTAGIQVLNTTDFPDDDGPIGQFKP